MHPPTKDHITGIGRDEPTADSSDGVLIERQDGEVITNKDTVRKEFAQDADLHHMLEKFGVVPPRGEPAYGEWDYTLDLQTAIAAVAEAKAAFNNLPDALKQKFNNMDEVLKAYTVGALVIKEGDAPAPQKTETELLQERIAQLEARIPKTEE